MIDSLFDGPWNEVLRGPPHLLLHCTDIQYYSVLPDVTAGRSLPDLD